MKPIYLSMQAFGPFKGNEEIDFSIFDTDQLFLISGQTGSGKTTIFDAMCYALFGVMTGDYRKDTSIRSQYADNNLSCKVIFEFSNNNIRYKVERSPRQKVLGRGGKLTEKNPTATLYQGDKILADKSSEVTKKVIELLGYDAKQFCRLVVLPQGKFIDILNAKPEDREEMLSTILQTDKYEKIANKIKDESSKYEASIRDVQSKVQGILEANQIENVEDLKNSLEAVEIDYLKKKEEKEKLDKEISDIQNLLATAEGQEAIKRNFDNVLDELTQLEKSKAYMNELSERVIKLTSVEKLVGIERQKNNAYTSVKRNEKSMLVHKSDLDNKILEMKKYESYKDQMEASIFKKSENSTKIIALERLKQGHEQYTNNQNKLRNLKTKIEENKKELMKAIKMIEAYSLDKEQLQVKNVKIEESLTSISDFKVEFQKLISLQEKVLKKRKEISEINKFQDEIKNLTKMVDDLAKDRDDKKAKVIEIEDIARQYQASILASNLEEGQACPVCGNTHHIILAKAGIEFSKDMLDAAKRDLDKANTQFTKAEALKLNKEEQCKKLVDSLDDEINEKEDYSKKITDLQQEIALENSFKQEQASINTRLATLEINTNKANEKKVSLTAQNDSIEAEIKELSNMKLPDKYGINLVEAIKELEEMNAKIDKDKEKYDEVVNKINKDIGVLNGKLDTISGELKKNKEEYYLYHKEFEEALAKSTMSMDEYNEMKPNVSNIKEYNDTFNQYNQKYMLKKGEKESLGKQVATFKDINIEGNKYILAEKKEHSKQVTIEYDELNSRRLNLSNAIHTINSLNKDSKSEMDAYSLYSDLSDILNGKKGGVKKISLQRYVLCLILDDILQTANNYLLRFTDGRYSFVRDETQAALSQRGLEMNIYDSNTDMVRSVSSLSGGESFIASLAFALGMSEEVGGSNGGIAIDTLFIDEGFGSLDDKMLNLALNALAEVKQGGKMIGIISHVEELKNVISAKVIVEKTKEGSHITTKIE